MTTMFRKPMRLEKWIAFDGAIGAEVLAVSQEPADNGEAESDFSDIPAFDDDGVEATETDLGTQDVLNDAPIFSNFADIMVLTAPSQTVNEVELSFGSQNIELEIPIVGMPDSTPGMPYYDTDIDVDLSGSSSEQLAYAKSLYFEITHTSGGKFSIYDGSDPAAIKGMGAQVGDWVAVINTSDGGDTFTFGLRNITSFGFDANHVVGKVLNTDTGLRFLFVQSSASSFSLERQIEIVLESLIFTPQTTTNTNTSPALRLYYMESGNPWDNDNFTDGPNSAFVPENTIGGIQDVTVPCDETGAPKEPGPENPPDPPDPPDPPEPPAPPDTPDPIIPPGPGIDDPDPGIPDPVPIDPAPSVDPPVDPTSPPIAETPGIEIGDAGPGSDASGDGDALADAGMDGDSDGQGAANDIMAYIYRRDDEGGEQDADSEDAGREEEAIGLFTVIKSESAEETAAIAAAMELAREFEELLESVKIEKYELELAIGRLQEEYLLLSADNREMVRAVLRDKFSVGNREMSAVNRIIEQMNRQIAVFRELPSDRRDGMMFNNLRELTDSAARRTGETSALAQALNDLADHLGGARAAAAPVPDGAELQTVFEQSHGVALEGWQAKAARADPMGRELARYVIDKDETAEMAMPQ